MMKQISLKNRLSVFVIPFLIVAFFLMGISTDVYGADRKKILVVVSVKEAVTLDPQVSLDGQSPLIWRAVYEPLLGLSPLMQAMLMKATREIRDEMKISIIVTEQYARPVFPIVDHAFILENGAAVMEGTREELMDNPDVRSAYFGVEESYA